MTARRQKMLRMAARQHKNASLSTSAIHYLSLPVERYCTVDLLTSNQYYYDDVSRMSLQDWTEEGLSGVEDEEY